MVSEAIAFHGVSLRWPDGSEALRSIDLQIGREEFVSVVGPSGCGKSTLLRLVAGLVPPTSGQIHRGVDSIEFIFQDPTLLPWLNVKRNVALPFTLSGRTESDLVDKALLDVGLDGAGHKLPRQLSGGMKMRASVARALITDPELFLLDEPFSAVDEMRRDELNSLLLLIHSQRRFAALFVTHSVSEAVLLADRVLVMGADPGCVREEILVPLDRTDRFSQRFNHDFVELTRQVSSALKASDT